MLCVTNPKNHVLRYSLFRHEFKTAGTYVGFEVGPLLGSAVGRCDGCIVGVELGERDGATPAQPLNVRVWHGSQYGRSQRSDSVLYMAQPSRMTMTSV